MTSLPTCRTWVFSGEGLLLNDWLLSPTRPLDLTARWSGSSPASNSLGSLPPRQLVQVLLYFGFPLLPVVTLLFVLVNLFSEAGQYSWRRSHQERRCHPQTLQLSYSVITLCLLTGVESVLTLVPILSRYMPMWSSFSTESGELETVGEDSRGALLHELTSQRNDTHWESDEAPRFLAQLPAVLTMQTVLRLVTIWITISLLGSRMRFISNTQADSYHFIHYYLSQSGADVEVAALKSSSRCSQSQHNRKSLFHCSCSKYSPDSDGSAAVCEMEPNPLLRMFRGKGCRACSLISCLLYTAVTVIVYLILCLPQMWSFRLERVLIHMPANKSQASSANMTGWRLVNGPSRTVSEYCLAVFGLLLPATLLFLSLLLLTVKSVKSERHLRRHLSQQLLADGGPQPPQEGKEQPGLPTVINSCLTRLRWESSLILSLGAIYLLFWLPRAATWQVHRIACLLNGSAKASLYSELFWPPQTVWLWSELANLVCNLISQLVLMISRSCSLMQGQGPGVELDLVPEMDQTELVGLELETVDEEDEETEDLVNGEIVVTGNAGEVLTQVGQLFRAGTPNVSNAGERSPCMHSHLGESSRGFYRPTSRILQDGFYTGSCDTPCASHDLRRRFMISPFCSRKYNSNQYLFNSPLVQRLSGLQNVKEQDGKYHHRYPSSRTTSTALPGCSLETNRVLLTYSPRSRHPFRPRKRNFLHANNISMSPMSDPRSADTQWRRSQSPPPLPPPPLRRRFSMIGDSSVYSTPHGSPKPQPAAIAVARSGLSSPGSSRVQFVETPLLRRQANCGSADVQDVQI